MSGTLYANAERRKQVRLKMRSDLIFTDQVYEGRSCKVVKDPISLKYYRFNEREHYVLSLLDGTHTMEEVQKKFEVRFRPDRLTLEDLESFARQLVTAGLVIHESPNAARHLFNQQKKQHRMKRIATFTNILYVKLPLFDPDRLLNWMIKYTQWVFTRWFLFASIAFMLSALALVTVHFQTFYDKLPTFNEFFRFRTFLYMWIALGFVKVIHEFGHGLTCKAFASECHEMGFLLLCLSPALYCNVTDAWTVSSKWKRILISFAGIYVELMIAAAATFVWWYTPHLPFVNNVALLLMTLCSVSTFVFNANPLMRFDGYYMMSDFLEIPNLRQRATKYLSDGFSRVALGIETQPEPYMAPSRKVLFVTYAIASYVYRWVITFSIVFFLATWLKPYKLETLSYMLAAFALGTMMFWPMYKLRQHLKKRGRLPDMKRGRLIITVSVFAALLTAFSLVPLPISRVIETGLVQAHPDNVAKVSLPEPGVLRQLNVKPGQFVRQGTVVAVFENRDLEAKKAEYAARRQMNSDKRKILGPQMLGVLPGRESDKMNIEGQFLAAGNEVRMMDDMIDDIDSQLRGLREVRAPRSGIVMSPPKPEQVGQFWDQETIKQQPLMKIGDPSRLIIRTPVDPTDYRLLREDLEEEGKLRVSIYIPGRSDHVFTGVVRLEDLPQTDAESVPIQLTDRAGGTLSVKPNQDPNVLQPIQQTYLLPVEIVDPDNTITPGTSAMVKIHAKWRSAAWWVWRGIASTFKWGILG